MCEIGAMGATGAARGGAGNLEKKMVESCSKAACSLSRRGDNADAAEGFFTGRMRSHAAAKAASVDKAVGMNN
jgi:hypothetical protein